MSGRTRDWLKFGTLVAIAFALGLTFASSMNLPRRSVAAEPAVLVQSAPPPVVSAKPVADLSGAFESVAENVKRAVVFVRSTHTEKVEDQRLPPGFENFFPQFHQRPRVEEGTGSGFIVSQDGYILTNNHVVAGTEHVTVRLPDKREFTARVVGADPATDVAVIKIDATGLPTVSFGNSDSARVGEWVLAIGNPLGEEFSFTVTAGIVSGKGRLLPDLVQVPGYSIQDFIQTDAAINPGNSGGPLVDIQGNVIGINAAIASETGYYQGYGFAVPINLARTVMNQLIATGHVARAVIGVTIREITPEDAQLVGLSDIDGVVVDDYSSDPSPAKEAGIRPGDVIVALDGKPVTYVAQLQQRVGFKKPGETVDVTLLRPGGVRKTVTVHLAAAPAADSTNVAVNAEPGNSSKASLSREDALGVSVQALSDDDLQDKQLAPVAQAGGGLVITDVTVDGPAYGRLAGPPRPDIVLGVNGTAVHTRAEFHNALRNVKAGDIVTLEVYSLLRGGREVVRLKAR